MERIRQIAMSLLVFSLIVFLVDLVLIGLGAPLVLCYGVSLCLTALTVYRIVSPTRSATTTRFYARRGKRDRDDEHLPRPIH
jgi:hypothetical protein